MAHVSAQPRLSQLWQLPLLLLSLALFGVAAYLFIDPRPGLSIEDKINIARAYLRQERPEAALEQLNRLLQTEKLERPREATIHQLLAESLEAAQRQRRISIPANHLRIIEQSQLALAQGIRPEARLYRRMGESYEALERPAEALSNYRQAMTLDPNQSLRVHRKIIDLQLRQKEHAAAEASIEQYLHRQITDSERAWALAEKSRLLIDRGRFTEAKLLLDEVLRLDSDPVNQGQVNYYLGYSAWKMGQSDEAERLLRLCREQLRSQHPLDGEASYLLGRIAQDRKQPREAISFFQNVLVSHPDSSAALPARLGRGLCRIMLGEDDAGLSDLHDLMKRLERDQGGEIELTLAGLEQAANLLSAKGHFGGALEVMAHEQNLRPQPPATFFARLSDIYEKRADQVEQSSADAAAPERIRRLQQARDMRCRAGDASIAYCRALTLADDKGYGEALWKGVDLYDRAGDLQRTIAALDLFVAERPDDPLAPEALLRLGRAYQAAGQFDKAIAAFQKNQFRYPNSLPASKSAVPLAQAYMAKGPEGYGRAEKVLLGVVENNPLLTPKAEEFRQALFELGQLFYRTGRYEEAVSRLEEWTQRYPNDEALGQLYFLMADSYRKSAGLLEVKAAAATQPADKAESNDAVLARRDRLVRARILFDRVIDLYRTTPPAKETDKLYQKLAHFYRADCVYDLGSFEEAIRLYDAASFRYQEDPSALAAYVQIVNAYYALGKTEEARTANERAKWLLRRMPADAFANGGFVMPKAYWEQWLKWTGGSGMW